MLDYNHLLCGLVHCVLQTSVRGQVAGHERQDPMTARLLKAEKLKVTVCNHVRTNGMIPVHPSSWRCYVQVDQELERATELLKESEDSRESLVQEVCLQLYLTAFAHQQKPQETKHELLHPSRGLDSLIYSHLPVHWSSGGRLACWTDEDEEREDGASKRSTGSFSACYSVTF